MITLDLLKKARILLLGFGREGQETLHFLRKHFPDKHIAVADKNETVAIQDANVDLLLGTGYLENVEDYDLIIKSPGIPMLPELHRVAKKVNSAAQLFFDLVDESNTIVAVTGSKGKSTTSSLLSAIIRASGKKTLLLGNIGTPLLSAVETRETILVCELSSYQLEHLHFRPDIAIWTSFFPDHLDYHGGLEAYFLAKTSITMGQRQTDIFLFHESHKKALKDIPSNAKKYMARSDDPVPTMQLPGRHNRENAQLALKASDLLGISRAVSEKVVANFAGLPHRLQDLGVYNGIRFIDDAISTTPESTIAAIESFPDEIDSILLGGTDRGYHFTELAKVIARAKIQNIVLFPESGETIHKIILEQGVMTPCFLSTKSMEEAVQFCLEHTQKGKRVLLSTASPSYSLWNNFEEKGDAFQTAIKTLAKKEKI